METPKLKPTIIDRSRLEQYAACPYSGYLSCLYDALHAGATSMSLFTWEKELLAKAKPELVSEIKKIALQAKDSKIAECGTEIHALIERAFRACNNDTSQIPEWFRQPHETEKLKTVLIPSRASRGRRVRGRRSRRG
jgi:hypothetical protein